MRSVIDETKDLIDAVIKTPSKYGSQAQQFRKYGKTTDIAFGIIIGSIVSEIEDKYRNDSGGNLPPQEIELILGEIADHGRAIKRSLEKEL